MDNPAQILSFSSELSSHSEMLVQTKWQSGEPWLMAETVGAQNADAMVPGSNPSQKKEREREEGIEREGIKCVRE
jgi:hypothetical protein